MIGLLRGTCNSPPLTCGERSFNMIKVIIGTKGTGKTKRLIEMVNSAVDTEKGHIVCLEYGDGLKYDISSQVRLINIKDYGISGFDAFSGFIKGLLACNYDISSVFVDGALKITGDDLDKLGETLADLEKVEENITITVLVSADAHSAPESVKKYIV